MAPFTRLLPGGLWLPALAALLVGVISLRYVLSESWTLVAQYPSGKIEAVSHVSYGFCQRVRGQVYLEPAPSEAGATIECVLR